VTAGAERKGPLAGIRVVEFAGIGPGPHAATLLADLGADVVRVQRAGQIPPEGKVGDQTARNRRVVEADLKDPADVEKILDLLGRADILIEGFRPGVMERMGLGPDVVLERCPRVVYGRMTGWGQDGPLALAAGHDLTYLAITGVLHGLGQDPDRPQFPVNLLGDFGGGSTYLVIGLLAALLEARLSGEGQVVDAAIVDGASHLNLMAAGMLASGSLTERRGTNLLDGGAPFYGLYRTSDDRWVAVGALEPQFFATLLRMLEIEDECPGQFELERYDEMRALLERTFATRSMTEWAELFEGTDGCVAPVLTPTEAIEHPHLAERDTFIELDGIRQPAPAPRFDRTRPSVTKPPAESAGAHTTTALEAWGIDDVDALIASGAAFQA